MRLTQRDATGGGSRTVAGGRRRWTSDRAQRHRQGWSHEPAAVLTSWRRRPVGPQASRPRHRRWRRTRNRWRRCLLGHSRRAEHRGHPPVVDERTGRARRLLADAGARHRSAGHRSRDPRRRVRWPLPARQGRRRRVPAARAGAADPVRAAGRARRPGPHDAAAPGRAAARRAADRCSTRCSSRWPPRASPAVTSRSPVRPSRQPPRTTQELVDPRYAPAQDALAAGDVDGRRR